MERIIPKDKGIIDTNKLKKVNQSRIGAHEFFSPQEINCAPSPEHSAEAIKSTNDIIRISEYLISNKRYRDNMLFIAGINFGLRVNNLRMLRFSDLINENMTFKESLNSYVKINNAVTDAVILYLENTPGVSLNDYMFKGESNRCNKNEPLVSNSIDRILKGIAKDLDLNIKVSTDTLRKTYCYHVMVQYYGDSKRMQSLLKLLNHKSILQTLYYIGVTSQEIIDAHNDLSGGVECAVQENKETD